MRTVLLASVALYSITSPAQTGPGGVGTAANNVLWLRGDRGVTTAGSAVTNWADQSGNANHATSPLVTSRPMQVPSTLNGYPVITFDGIDDELRIPDAASLDLTQWHMFFVGAETNPGSNNAWFSKGSSTQPNYGMWSPINGALMLPVYDILGIFNAPSAPAGTTNTSYNVVEYSNRVLFIFFPYRTLYKNAVSVYTDGGFLQLPATNGSQLFIGDTQDNTGWNLDGSMAELILYNSQLNAAQRIIVDNYLSAKYGRMLGTSDLYVQDNPLNGDYDHDVAGIGRVNSSNIHNDARGSGIVQINTPSGLGDNEFLFWGHDNGALGSWGVADIPPTVQARIERVWRVSEVNASGAAVDVGSVNMTWDLSGLGPITTTDLRLLVDTDNDGIFADETPIGPPTNPGGNLYRFTGVTALVNNRRFTIASINVNDTPLPVELLDFTAEALGPQAARLSWATASEHNNDHFTIERSTDGAEWMDIAEVDGAQHSLMELHYTYDDREAPGGQCYYRLRQTDLDGTSTWSDMVVVHFPAVQGAQPVVHPNPSDGPVIVILPDALDDALGFSLMDARGAVTAVAFQKVGPGRYRVDPGQVPSGTYVLLATRPDSEVAYSIRILR